MNSISMILCVFCATLVVLLAPGNTQSTTTPIDDNEMGMGILYDMVNIFLGDVVHKEKIGDSFLNLSTIFKDGELQDEEIKDWKKWAEYLIGFAVCAAIGIVFIVVMPIIGIIFCCCRLCGRCGHSPGKNAHKRAKCKRRSYCTVLIILTTIALAGVVCAFVCNSLLYKHLQNDNNEGAFGHVNQALKQIENFINNTIDEYSNYVNNTYHNKSQEIILKIKDSANDVVEKVMQDFNVGELLFGAINISKEANETKQKLDDVFRLLMQLRFDSNQLKDNLTDIKNSTIAVCNKTGRCSKVNASEFDTEANFNSLGNLSDEADTISKALNLESYIAKANDSLKNVKVSASKDIDQKVNDSKNAVKDVQVQITRTLGDLKKQKDNVMDKFSDLDKNVDEGKDKVKEYSKYVYYGVIGVCLAYLLVVVLYYTGLLFGMCGEKPGDGAPCCNTGCGAHFLFSGVAATFIFSSILMIICVVLFCIGGPLYTEVCRHFQGHDPAAIKDFDGLIKNAIKAEDYFNISLSDFSISGAIQNCQENKTLYTALQLDNVFNLNKTLDISKLITQLNDVIKVDFNMKNITISEDLSESLENLTKSGLDSVNFTEYFIELSKQLTRGNLSEMASIVQEIADKETDATDKATLNNNAQRLQQLHNQAVPAIQETVAKLNATLTDLQQKNTLVQNAQKLINDLTSAENSFNINKNVGSKEYLKILINDTVQIITSCIDIIKKEVRENVGKCRNLSNALFTMSDAVCIQILEPVNGLWFSFGWCLFFFVPCLIFAVLLADQYRRTLDDDKEFDEQNYMMYGGPNPDTIPLTSVDRTSGSSAHPRSGMMNAGYRDESKRSTHADPPPYNSHAGISAYAPPMDQHQWQAKAYPAQNGDGFMAGNGAKGSYSYPY